MTTPTRDLIGRDDVNDLDAILARWQRSLIDAALHENSGNVSRAASRLGLRRTTLYSRLT